MREFETKTVTLRELVEAMKHVSDDEVFRFFQDSVIVPSKGWHEATITYKVTMGQVRKELGLISGG